MDYFRKQGFFPSTDQIAANKDIGSAFYQMIMLPGQALGNLLLKTLVAKSNKKMTSDKVKAMVTQLAISQIVEIFNQYGPIVPVNKKWCENRMDPIGDLLLTDMHYWQRRAVGNNMVSNIPTIVAMFAYWCGRFGHLAETQPSYAFFFSIEWMSVYQQSYKALVKAPEKNWPRIWMDFYPKFTVIGGEKKGIRCSKTTSPFRPKGRKVHILRKQRRSCTLKPTRKPSRNSWR